MKKIILVLVLSIATVAGSFAQTEEEEITQPQEQSTYQITPYYGLTFGLGIGNYTSINLRPMVGFHITPKFSAGMRVNYEYIKDKRSTYDIIWNNYGASIFGRYRFVPRFYGHAEFAYNNYTYKILDEKQNNWVPLLLIGGGYVQPLGNNVALVAEILFDVIQDENSPYSSYEPFWSIGVQVGF